MSSSLMPNYARSALSFSRGHGCRLETGDGDEYLDFGSGIAVNSLGHCHPAIVAAITDQAGRLWHTSNLYVVELQERLARRLTEASFADAAFFCNSGAEANECAIKMARRYQWHRGRKNRTGIIAFQGAFHGRTLGTLAAAGQSRHLEGFGPPAPGFIQLPFGDIDAVNQTIREDTCAILVEPIQGEAGIRMPPDDFLECLRDLCDAHDLLLIADEVQTGIGRTGKLFAYEWTGGTPDILTSAKGLGAGFPVGACLATDTVAQAMIAGTHGSTFGGNPLAMAVGNAVLDIVLADGFLESVQSRAEILWRGLQDVATRHPAVFGMPRGRGLLVGLPCIPENKKVVAALAAEKLLVVPASDNTIRILPPLIVSEAEIGEALEKFERVASQLTVQN